MRDLLCKDLWLLVQCGSTELESVDALTWEVMHLKTITYIQCFIVTNLYNNFDDETKADVLWKKI